MRFTTRKLRSQIISVHQTDHYTHFCTNRAVRKIALNMKPDNFFIFVSTMYFNFDRNIKLYVNINLGISPQAGTKCSH
jgi:hypothetical protein